MSARKTKAADKSRREECPRCGANAIPIAYGMPSVAMFKEAELGGLVLGGCCVGPDNPAWRCEPCDWSW